MPQILEACWAFRCPECGFDHEAMGWLAQDHEIYCEVCQQDSGRQVKLQRWLIEETEQEAASKAGTPRQRERLPVRHAMEVPAK